MTEEPWHRIVIPVEESRTLRDTVAYGVAEAIEAATAGNRVEVHFVYVVIGRSVDEIDSGSATPPGDLLEQISIWAESDLEEATETESVSDLPAVRFETAAIGTERYLYAPTDYAEEIEAYAIRQGIDRVIVDPAYEPVGYSALLRPLVTEIASRGLEVSEAPVDRATRRRRFPQGRGILQFLTLFGVSFAFYLLLAWTVGPVDVATGLISASIVAIALSRVSLTRPIPLRGAIMQLARFSLYVPYLAYEVTKANLALARVILHPSLPIDPAVVRFRAAVWGGLPVTTLANSITLTPGTLTIDVGNQEFIVHTLTQGARSDLLGGGLELAVRYIFLGRAAARIPSPRERAERTEGAEDE
jgi:multicomponent Na+:H+ antiporter subunit E